MHIFLLGKILEETDLEQYRALMCPAVFAVRANEAEEAFEYAGIKYEGEINLSSIDFCKVESEQDGLSGSLCIPRFVNGVDGRYRIQFFINKENIVLIDDDDFTLRMLRRIQQSRTKQGDTKEHFIYHFLLLLLNRDVDALRRYERIIMELEEKVLAGKTEGFQNRMIPMRRELLMLRGYYDQLMDMGKEMEENENGFFAKKRLNFFGIIADRSDRMMGRTAYLLEYASQVSDAYQAQVDAQQNKNTEFLTIVSAIFFPLTLITGWYGMNFENMPELENGYPGVIALSLIVIFIIIYIFKKKKIL